MCVCVSVPWCISHAGRTAGWWAPWWGRWQTGPQGCRERTRRGPSLTERREADQRHDTVFFMNEMEIKTFTQGGDPAVTLLGWDLPPLSVLLRAPSLWGHSSHLWGTGDEGGEQNLFWDRDRVEQAWMNVFVSCVGKLTTRAALSCDSHFRQNHGPVGTWTIP